MANPEMDIYDEPTGDLMLTNGGRLHLSRIRQLIFGHLLRIRPRVATAAQLAALVYGDEDGPEDERKTIAVHMHKLAGFLAACSIRVVGPGYRKDRGGYCLEGDVIWLRRKSLDCCPCCGQKMPDER